MSGTFIDVRVNDSDAVVIATPAGDEMHLTNDALKRLVNVASIGLDVLQEDSEINKHLYKIEHLQESANHILWLDQLNPDR